MTDALTRRGIVRALAASSVLAGVQAIATESDLSKRKGRIKQSVARWCYSKISVDALSAYGAEIGLKAVDLLNPDEFEIPRRYGLICSMGYAEAGTIGEGLNRIENHAAIEEGLRKNIPIAAKAMVPNVITFSGNRGDLSDDQGLKKYSHRIEPRQENCRRSWRNHLHGVVEQQGEPSRLYVRSHSVGRACD